MNLLSLMISRLRCLTPLESAVLRELEAALPPDEGNTLALQLRIARIKRHCSGHTVKFSYPRPVEAIGRLAAVPFTTLAIVSARGLTSGFKTTASIRMAEGILAWLDFDPIPWPGREPLEVVCKLCDPGWAAEPASCAK